MIIALEGLGSSVDIFLGKRKVGDRILPIALEELHRDAIYFLAGIRYKVKEFDYPEKQLCKARKNSKGLSILHKITN